MERNDWLMDEDRLEGRRTFMLSILDEAGQLVDVVEGVGSIKKVIKEYERYEGNFSKGKASNRR